MATKKKRFVVKPRTPRVMENGLTTTKGNIGFNGKTQKIITDESVAREIDTEYGLGGKRDVFVYEDERLEWHDEHDKQTDGMNHDKGGHRYFFGPSQRFANAWDAFEKRRKDKPHAARKTT
jgi:hypothetical protein